MGRRGRWRTVPLVVGLLGGCAAPAPGPPPATRVWDVEQGWTALPAAPATEPTYWWNQPITRSGDPVADAEVAVDARSVVVAESVSTGTLVRRLDAATGATTWTAEAVAGDVRSVRLTGPASAPVAAVSVEAADASTHVVVLDETDGRVVFQGSSDRATVAASADLVVISELGGTTAIDRRTGGVRWRTGAEVRLQDGSWLATGSPGSYAVLDPATGVPRWSRPRMTGSDATIVGDLVVITGNLGGGRAGAEALDLATGAPRWTAADLPPVGPARTLALDPDSVLVDGGDGASAAVLDRATGAARWTRPGGGFTTLEVGGAPVVVQLAASRATIVDTATGRSTAEAGRPANTWTIAGGLLYSGGGGRVAAFDLPGLVERWVLEDPGGPPGAARPVEGGFVVHGHSMIAGHLRR